MTRPQRYERKTPYDIRDVPFADDSRFFLKWCIVASGAMALAVWWAV